MHRLQQRLFAPVDITWLVFFRIAFGVTMLVEVCRFFQHGWISRNYSPEDFHFTYYGFEWVRPWPGVGMEIHFAVLGVAAACVAAGFCYRVAAAVFCVGFTYVFLLEETRYLNHFYLICLVSLLMIFLPANRALAVDSCLRPGLRSHRTPAWTLWLMRAQIGIPYFFGGIAKLNGDWLHGEPMRMWLAKRAHYPVIGPHVGEEWLVYFFVLGGLLLDLLVVPALLWRRTRLVAYASVVAFHLMNATLFRIGIFPWLMLAATLIFFPPETLRCWLPLLKEGTQGDAVAGDAERTPTVRRQRVTLALLGCYLAVQVLAPLRHFLYPGNVHWTEEGHRFSWHMKLRSKDGQAHFEVYDPVHHELWIVDPEADLRPEVVAKMVTHPDMILQYSHHLAEQKRREGREAIQVRARVMASLNGRVPQVFINPMTDLAQVRRTLGHCEWVLPLETPLESRATKPERKAAARPGGEGMAGEGAAQGAGGI